MTRAISTEIALICLSAGLFPAFLAVWRGQAEGQAPLADGKFHAARVWVCIQLTALAGVLRGIGGKALFQVGIVGSDMDEGTFLIESDFRDFLRFCQSCFHFLPFCASRAKQV